MVMQLGVNLRGCDRTQEDCKNSNLFIPVGGWGLNGITTPPTSFTPPDFNAPGAAPNIPAFTHPSTVGWAAAGTYTLRCDGAANCWYNGTFDIGGLGGQSHSTTLPGTGETSFYINSVVPGNPITNMRLLGPRSDDTSFFTPTYLESLKGLKDLRFFDWEIGVGSSVNVYNPPPIGDFGYAPEVTDWSQVDLRPGRGPRGICDLLLALRAVHGTSPDLWINIPYRCAYFTAPETIAVTGYAQTLGSYLAARVPPGTKVYVELADEMWNFSIYDNYLVEQGTFGHPGPRYETYGLLSNAVWEAFEAGFGGNCVRTLNGQYVWPEGNLVDALAILRARGKRVDAIASAPYWWIYPNSTVGSDPIKAAWAGGDHAGALAQFFAALHRGIDEATRFLPDWQSIAATYGVRNVCYEGGLSTTPYWWADADLKAVWDAAMEDPRMATAVRDYLAALAPFVDLFHWFNHCGTGSWGAALDASDWGSARMNGLRAFNGLAPMDPNGTYASDGYGSTGANYIPTPAPTSPAITWPNPSPIAYPAPLSATQLNATTGVPGTFVYTPASGIVLGVGNAQTLSTTFLPTDQARYAIVGKQVSIDVTPGPVAAGSCVFIRQDAATQGSWIGAYGADGYDINASPAALPSYASIAFSAGIGSTVWAAGTPDVRALQLPGGAGRTAATWFVYVATSFTLDITIAGGQEHDLAIYFIDWDNWQRVQSVVVKDPLSGAVYDSRTISSFQGGVYLVYRLGGHVQFTVTRTAGISTVLSGLFFDPAGSPTPTPTPTGRWRRWSGALGRSGGRAGR